MKDTFVLWIRIVMKYTVFRDSIYILQQPVYTNPYGWIRDGHKHIADALNNQIASVKAITLERLVESLHEDMRMSSLLILFLETMNSGASLMNKTVGLSVVLEGLTNIVTETQMEKLKPIPSKSIEKQFKFELMQVLEKFKSETPEINSDILRKKIQNINAPTNADKLTQPFKLLGYDLKESDRKAINYRNDFLHGRLSLGTKDSNQYASNSIETELWVTTLRLYTLITILILKPMGHKGKIWNHVKTQISDIEEDYCIDI